MKVPALVMRFATFINEVSVELKKSTWPTRPELLDSTIVVILSVIALGVLLGISDFVLVRLIGIIL